MYGKLWTGELRFVIGALDWGSLVTGASRNLSWLSASVISTRIIRIWMTMMVSALGLCYDINLLVCLNGNYLAAGSVNVNSIEMTSLGRTVVLVRRGCTILQVHLDPNSKSLCIKWVEKDVSQCAQGFVYFFKQTYVNYRIGRYLLYFFFFSPSS